MVRSVLSLAVAVAVAVFGLPWCVLLLHRQWLAQAGDPWPQDPLSVAAGVAVGVALVCWKRPNWFIHTAIHECCHLLVCMLLLVPVHSFRASGAQGGEVTHTRPDPIRETLIAIAPYTVPLLLVPCLLAVRLVPDGPWHALASGLSGFAYIHHVQGIFHNVRLNFWGKDSDLFKIGRPLSLVLISAALLLVTTWAMAMLWP